LLRCRNAVTIAPRPSSRRTWHDYRHREIKTAAAHRLRRLPRALSQDRVRLSRGEGLISKHFIWSESGWAGGVYQWERIEDAGPWLDGIVERYGMKPQIEFYEGFAVTDNARDKVELFKETVTAE
jgi:hypothetical protein